MRRALILFPLLLAALGRADKESSQAQLGDLRIAVTSVEPAAMQLDEPIVTTARNGYHLVAVNVQVANVSDHPACTEFNPLLVTNVGDRYVPIAGTGSFWPETFNLASQHESHGKYIFEVKDGQEPAELLLSRDVNVEDLCAMAQDRIVSDRKLV